MERLLKYKAGFKRNPLRLGEARGASGYMNLESRRKLWERAREVTANPKSNKEGAREQVL